MMRSKTHPLANVKPRLDMRCALPLLALMLALPVQQLLAASAQEAREFTLEAEARLAEMSAEIGPIFWLQQVFTTDDTNALAARAGNKAQDLSRELAQAAQAFDGVEVDDDTARKLRLLKQGAPLKDPELADEQLKLGLEMSTLWSQGQYCDEQDNCRGFRELDAELTESREFDVLTDAWVGWRTTAPVLRDKFTRLVELNNLLAQELGYADMGSMWREQYDMQADDFAAQMDQAWQDTKPLFESLQCHVRAQLADHYGEQIVALDKPIPANLLGDMHAMVWSDLYDIVSTDDLVPSFSLADISNSIEASGMSEQDMARHAENFYLSLGFDPLPETFWTRSNFTKPVDHQGLCYANAPHVDTAKDVRINMCVEKTGRDFGVLHHELGHSFYELAYSDQPFLYRTSANDGFHEAVGEVALLSVTPGYLHEIGMLESMPDNTDPVAGLLRIALDRVALLPWAYMVDQWRWKVFSGEITPDNYNASWWEMRERYQGIAPPVARSEADFDPGSKFHIAANVSYARYFLAGILQFQFHQALCEKAGHEGPLHTCSVYQSKQAGKAFQDMLAMGASKPWQDALETLTGTRELSGKPLLAYFAPLKSWLDEKNEGRQCGW